MKVQAKIIRRAISTSDPKEPANTQFSLKQIPRDYRVEVSLDAEDIPKEQNVGKVPDTLKDQSFNKPISFFSSKRVINSALVDRSNRNPMISDKRAQRDPILEPSDFSSKYEENSGTRRTNSLFRVVNRRMSASPNTTNNQQKTLKDTTMGEDSTVELEVYRIRDHNEKGMPALR
jgi:hypothetical protein